MNAASVVLIVGVFVGNFGGGGGGDVIVVEQRRKEIERSMSSFILKLFFSEIYNFEVGGEKHWSN